MEFIMCAGCGTVYVLLIECFKLNIKSYYTSNNIFLIIIMLKTVNKIMYTKEMNFT